MGNPPSPRPAARSSGPSSRLTSPVTGAANGGPAVGAPWSVVQRGCCIPTVSARDSRVRHCPARGRRPRSAEEGEPDMELGLHIANFTWTGGAAELGDRLGGTAKAAEDAGFTRVTVMDHFWQIGPIGPPELEMLEAYTALGFLAARTERVQLHTLVTGIVYRQPGLLAKAVTTLDVLSGGRAGLGIGAAWNDEEARVSACPSHRWRSGSNGWRRPCRSACRCGAAAKSPITGPTTSWAGPSTRPRPSHARTRGIMIGGTGERKTLRLVARYARRLQHLRGARERPQAGRPPSALRTGRPRLRGDREDVHGDDPGAGLGRRRADARSVASAQRHRIHGRLRHDRRPGPATGHRGGRCPGDPRVSTW